VSLPAAPKLPGNAFSTLLNADAIEFVPQEGLEDVFVCGTYQLKAGDEGLKVPHRCCARTIAHNAITRVRNFVTSCSPLVACAGQAEEQTRLGRLWVLEVVQVLPRPRPRGPFLLTVASYSLHAQSSESIRHACVRHPMPQQNDGGHPEGIGGISLDESANPRLRGLPPRLSSTHQRCLSLLATHRSICICVWV
jgi:hypothetical protein